MLLALLLANGLIAACAVRLGTPARGASSARDSTWTQNAQPSTPLSASAPESPLKEKQQQQQQEESQAGVAASVSAELAPRQFLIISSPRERKIVYTELKDFRSTTGRTYTLIDTGLQEPSDIAFDHRRGKLYVADKLQGTVFRYNIVVDSSRGGYRLQTDGGRVTILVNKKVGGLTVDVYGTVFFTDEVARSVNRLTAQVVDMLGASDLVAEELGVTRETELENASSSSLASMMQGLGELRADSRLAPTVQALYEEEVTPHAAAPTGVASDGMRLYWANGRKGQSRGVVVEGQTRPQAPLLTSEGRKPGHFPVSVIANNTDSASCLVQTSSMLLFSGEAHGSGAVFAVSKSGGPVFRYLAGLSQPRGLVWDGDNTVYVADAGGSRVYSIPVNRHIDGTPAEQVVDFSGAHGLALLSVEDEAWGRVQLQTFSGALPRCGGCWTSLAAMLPQLLLALIPLLP